MQEEGFNPFPPPPLAHSSLEIRSTPITGRGVITTAPIAAGTHLLTSADLVTFTLHREYRREVCGQCFAYNRGVTWKLKDSRTETGLVWCSDACETAWRTRHNNEDVVTAFAAVETLISKAKGHRGDMDILMSDTSTGAPDEEAIARTWVEAEKVGDQILAARTQHAPSKALRRVIQEVRASLPSPTLLTYSLSAVLAAHAEPRLWKDMLDLEIAPRPYHYFASLDQHKAAYLQLLYILPLPLTKFCTPHVMLAAINRDMRNSFGLRSLDDGGSEMFGYGTWPSASYWNHSCRPSVGKRREGRAWHFYAERDLSAGEELCISYLGGDEKTCDVVERRKKLADTWAFECNCAKCELEAAS